MVDVTATERPPLGIRLLHALRREPDWSAMTAEELVAFRDAENRRRASRLLRVIGAAGAPRVAAAARRLPQARHGMHALPHFYASVLLSPGVSIKELAAYLGHNDPGFTLRTYPDLVPSSFECAPTAVDAVFSPTGPTTDGLQTA